MKYRMIFGIMTQSRLQIKSQEGPTSVVIGTNMMKEQGIINWLFIELEQPHFGGNIVFRTKAFSHLLKLPKFLGLPVTKILTQYNL